MNNINSFCYHFEHFGRLLDFQGRIHLNVLEFYFYLYHDYVPSMICILRALIEKYEKSESLVIKIIWTTGSFKLLFFLLFSSSDIIMECLYIVFLLQDCDARSIIHCWFQFSHFFYTYHSFMTCITYSFWNWNMIIDDNIKVTYSPKTKVKMNRNNTVMVYTHLCMPHKIFISWYVPKVIFVRLTKSLHESAFHLFIR